MGTDKTPAKKAAAQKVMDVAKPGKSAPAATSRPVIVGHGPMIQDPMMSDNSSSSKTTIKVQDKDENPDAKLPTVTHNKVIKPLTLDGAAEDTKKVDPLTAPIIEEKPDKPEESEPPKSAEEPAKEEPAPAEPEAETAEDEKPDEAASETETPETDAEANAEAEAKSSDADAGVVDAVAEQATKKKKTKADAEAEKRQEALNKLVDEKKYFVPTGQVTHRRRTRGVIVLVLLLLLVIGGYGALDAQLIKNNIALPFQLIKETEDTAKEPAPTPPSGESLAVGYDKQRQNDINAIHDRIENYNAETGLYPTFANMNDAAFRASELGNLEAEKFRDPEGSATQLVVTPAAKVYAYVLKPSNCDNKATKCAEYTLSAILSDAQPYQKLNLN